MRDFRRAVIRLLFTTAFLLFGAWAALKVMQYHGDVEAMLRDLQSSGAARFVQEKVMPIIQDQLIPFFRDQVGPKLKELTDSAKEMLESHTG